MEEVHIGETRLDWLNYATATLKPKKSTAETIGDYRPISPVNRIMKIVSKVLANKLQHIPEEEIVQYQKSFIRNKNILDGIVIAQEIIHQVNKRKEKRYVLKLDFEKAYDTVNWECLTKCLRNKGFGPKWQKWIWQWLDTVKTNITINGKLGERSNVEGI